MSETASKIHECPAKQIVRCPLYIESHVGSGRGCVDDLAQPCLVARGHMDFHDSVFALAQSGIAHPGMIEALNCVRGCQ